MVSWLNKDPEAPGISKAMRGSILYFRKLHRATPSWVNFDQIKSVYDQSERLRASGFDVHVDHIVPLRSNIVCGLHVPWNLKIITAEQNLHKSNAVWPDHPYENLDLFGIKEVEQYELPLPL